MKKCFIGFGSNLGNRLGNLERAAHLLGVSRVSPVYESAALVPPGAPASWNLPFLNAVAELNWAGTAQELLNKLKNIERELGRLPSERWAPRLIDLDILLFGDEKILEPGLRIPHSEMHKRAFVLDPLKDLAPAFLAPARSLVSRSPLWMGILNLTPDSFSDGGVLTGEAALLKRLDGMEGAAFLDLGAESTRPGATPVSPGDEWLRLEPALKLIRDRFRDRIFRPRVSVDTRHAETAERAIELGADIINDVSGLSDPAMAKLVRQSGCEYVLMHSLSVPADGKLTLQEDIDPIRALLQWAAPKLEQLSAAGVSTGKVYFDPGVGFGKTPAQSIELLKRVSELFVLNTRILVGHSRKGFLNSWGEHPARDRDWESVGVSLQLAQVGVDVIRVHEPDFHARAFRAFQGVSPCPPSA